MTLSLAAMAQSTFGTMLGTVKDASGGVIPNANVKIVTQKNKQLRPAERRRG
jgi:hypothetical protein